MKVLFLDIDGVLVATHDGDQSDEHYRRLDAYLQNDSNTIMMVYLKSIPPARMALLNQIAVDGVVLSSSWRNMFSLSELRLMFFLAGCRHKILGVTGNMRGTRGEQIAAYLHGKDWEYLIVDDDTDFLPTQKPRCVITSTRDGLTRSDVCLANSILCDC